jgi:thiol-disulfide isomerase/thioredoxin
VTITSGQPAPAVRWTLDDADGQAHTIDLANPEHPIVLGVYKSSCAASKAMMPMLDRISRRHAGSPLAVYGVAQDSANITRSFARRLDISYPILIEGGQYPVSSALEVGFTPTVFVINTAGVVDYTTMGFLRDQANDIERAVATLLGVPFEPIVSAAESDVPLFVPG